MKKKDDPRHIARVNIMKNLFINSFNKTVLPEKNSIEAQVLAKSKQIELLISRNAPSWPIDQVAQIDLAILKLAIWELLFKKAKEPYKAVVDEAVELAKEYGSDMSASFVNGVLGSIIKAKPKTKIN
ncbi:MAG: transcription antitermination factor NusB [Patescibacteria group bacterium]